MYIKTVSATGQKDLTPEGNAVLGRVDTKVVNCVEFTVDGIAGATGSMIPQIQQVMDGDTTTPPGYKNCQYANVATGAVYAAGTAITADGSYVADTPGNLLSMNVTACTGSFSIYVSPLQGPGVSGSSGGGGAVTLASGAVASGAYSAGSIAAGAAVSGAFVDGAIATLGANADAAVGDATGTVNAHLRQIAKVITAGVEIANDAGNPLPVTGASADNSANSTAKVPAITGLANAADPSWTEGRQVPLSVTLAGQLRIVDETSVSSPIPVATTPTASASTEAGTMTITTGGTAQTVFSSNSSRVFLAFENNSDTDMLVRFGASNATASIGFLVKASGGSLSFSGAHIPSDAVTVYCATTGKAFYAVQA